MICKLCKNDKELRNSHIIPEHIYGSLYNDKHKCIGITADGDSKKLQKGFREQLLCNDCEQFLNDKYEKYFFNFWIKNNTLPSDITSDHLIVQIDNYLKFKLYHFSILFRASVSSHAFFSGVFLGAHEEIIRSMLLNESDNKNYTLFGTIICNNNNKIEDRIIVQPGKKRYAGHIVYQMIYAGCAWYLKVSNHRCKDIEEFCLKPDGKLQLTVDKMHEFAEIINIHNALNTNENSKQKQKDKA